MVHRAKTSTLTFILTFAVYFQLFAQPGEVIFFEKTDHFLKKHVQNGRIDYQKISENPGELDALVQLIANFQMDDHIRNNVRKAFWINAYNLLVIKNVVDHYPLKSPQDVNGFFNKRKFVVARERLTLDQIEHQRLRKIEKDGRIHFALICAAKGCPKIITDAFKPGILDQQLDERARETINNPFYVKPDPENKRIFVSELFKWYGEDFKSNDKSLVQFLNQYLKTPIPRNYTIAYIPYDWRLNALERTPAANSNSSLRTYTPSTLLKQGEIEIKQFNNLYTQTAFFNDRGIKKVQNGRSTFFTGVNEVFYGISPNFNLGLDLFIKSVRFSDESTSAFAVFNFSNKDNSRTALSQIAPKVKFNPFPQRPKFAIQSTLLFPVANDLDGSTAGESPFLDVDGVQWWTQFFVDQTLKPKWLAYYEAGFVIRFSSPFEDFFTPLKAIYNYYATNRWTLYFPIEITPFWSGVKWTAFYGQLGFGGKYQLSSFIEIEMLFTKFLIGKNQGAGQTFNLGWRVVF